jgi:hypothetical protein
VAIVRVGARQAGLSAAFLVDFFAVFLVDVLADVLVDFLVDADLLVCAFSDLAEAAGAAAVAGTAGAAWAAGVAGMAGVAGWVWANAAVDSNIRAMAESFRMVFSLEP